MSVIVFKSRTGHEGDGWTDAERRALDAFFEARVRRDGVVEAAVVTTDLGDPQYFILGPAPACECVLSISRVSTQFVVEDGGGRVLIEVDNLAAALDAASRLRLRRDQSSLVAKAVLAWISLREFVEERTDAAVEEAVEAAEILAHVVPQVAMLA